MDTIIKQQISNKPNINFDRFIEVSVHIGYHVTLSGRTFYQDENGEEVDIDPQVEALQKELQGIKSVLSKQETTQMEAKKAEITAYVHSFAADPKNIYFEELANDIAHLLRTKAEPSVEKAYEAAIWRNPAVRAKELARQQTEKTEAEKKAAAEKAATAKRATEVNVRSSARRGSAATPAGSIDDTLNETLAKIVART